MASSVDQKEQIRTLLRENRLQEAKVLLQGINDDDPGDWECWHMLGSIHGMLGELVDAERCSRKAVTLDKNAIGGYINLGNALFGLGKLAEAEECFRTALGINPDQPDIHMNLGNLFKAQNRVQDAEFSYREAIRLNPNYADAFSNLAILQQEQGKIDSAIASYRQALQLMPSNPSILYNLASALRKKGNLDEAKSTFEAVLQSRPDHAESHNGIGSILESQGRYDGAVMHYKAALAIKPKMEAARRRLNMLYGRAVPGWHFPMMNDEERNGAYDRALRKVVTRDLVVLDIGSGSGLLAMMAARAGAKHIYTCEVNTLIAEKARTIVEINDLSDVITVINKKSTDLVVGQDLPEKADILVSEILDECLLGEGVVPSVFHARTELVKEGGIIIPASATMYAALVESERLHEYYCVDTASGFDVSQFNEFSRAPYTNLRLSTFPHRVVSQQLEAFHFDLTNPNPNDSGEQVFKIAANEDCVCHAVIYWFTLDLDNEISLETSPFNDASCWMQAAQVPMKAIPLKAGQEVKVLGKFDSMSVRFTIVP